MVHCIVLLLLLSLFCPANAENIRLPKIRYAEEDNADAEVIRTGRIAERPDPENLTMRGTRKGCAAAAIVRKNIRYDWAPGIDRSQASGPAAIRDAALSGDATILAVLERLGEPPGPYGTRLVFLNTANGTVLRYLELNSAECTRLFFSSGALLLLQKGREEHPDTLLFLPIFPFSGKTEERFRFPQRVSGFCPGPDGTLLIKAGVTLCQFSPEGKKTAAWKLRSPGGTLVCAPAEKRVFNLFPGRVERCRIDRERIIFEENIPFDGTPGYAIPVRSWLLAGEPGQMPQLLFCDQQKPPLRLGSACSGTGLFDNGMLFMVLERNRDIGIFRLPNSPRPQSLIKVNHLRPQTNGEVRFLFRIPGRILDLLALDDRANLIRLRTYRRNNFQKTLLFSPAEEL